MENKNQLLPYLLDQIVLNSYFLSVHFVKNIFCRRKSMPIYEFVCPKCGEEFEELVLGSNKSVICKKCGSPEVEKKMSAFAFKAGTKFVGTGKKATSACSGCTSTSCSSCGG